MASIHVSLNAEPIYQIGGFTITNSIFTSALVSFIIILLAFIIKNNIKQTNKPTGIQNITEALIEGFYNLVHTTTHNHKKTAAIFPWVASFFFFILLNNWFGLLPGVNTILVPEYHANETEHAQVINTAHAVEHIDPHQEALPSNTEPTTNEPDHEEGLMRAGTAAEAKHHGPIMIPLLRAGTADLNTTLALAIISIFMTQIIGLKFLGAHYLSKFFNLNGVHSFVGILEVISEISKIISFAFRLFGNIFAGEVLLVVIASLLPIIAPIPFIGLEIFVGAIQALVFAMLTLVFMNLATQSHGEDH